MTTSSNGWWHVWIIFFKNKPYSQYGMLTGAHCWCYYPGPSLNINTIFPGMGIPLFNSLAPGKFEWNFSHVIFKQILVIDDWGISCEIALTWRPLDLTDDKSTLVQVMAWCRQATSHYLSQCSPSSLSPYGVTRPQWVKIRWSWDRLIFNPILPILVRWHLYIETAPWYLAM